MEWISVEDRLPDQVGCYLTCYKDEEIAIAAYWPHFKIRWMYLDIEKSIDPTHWMPLPEPPKE